MGEFHHGDQWLYVLAPELCQGDRIELSLDDRWALIDSSGGSPKKIKGRCVVRCIFCRRWEWLVWNGKGWNVQQGIFKPFVVIFTFLWRHRPRYHEGRVGR